jgi:hypothetical protein
MYKTNAKCSYFETGLENFGLIMKGASLENIEKIHNKFDHCFLINNFDPELDKYGKFLENKKIVHFVNKLFTAHMFKKNYERFDIKNIQMSTNFFLNFKLLRAWLRYKKLGLKVHFMNKEFDNKNSYFNKFFEGKFRDKFPNAGVLAICYTLDVIRPKNLWICGLDFFSEDYIYRRPHQTPLNLQQKKIQDSELPEKTMEIMSLYKHTNINLYSYYKNLNTPSNVKLLK